MWMMTADLPTAASHPFYWRLNQLLREHGFDDFAEAQCATFYAETMGRLEVKMANRNHYHDYGLIFAQSWEHVSGKSADLGAGLAKWGINKNLVRLCAIAKVRPITVHGLRHTSATLLLAAGVPPHVVQRRLGHKRVEMTLNLYAHVLPSMQADAASRLAVLLHG
jgi:integrase